MKSNINGWFRSPFVVFSIVLFCKMSILRLFLFGEIRMPHVLADLSSILLLFILFEIPRKRFRWPAYWVVNAAVSLALFAAALYFKHFGSIVTYTAFAQLNQVWQIGASVKDLLRPIHFIFFADFLAALALFVFLKVRRKRFGYRRMPIRLSAILGAAAVIWTAVSFMRTESTGNELIRADRLGFFNYQVSFAWNALEENRSNRFASLEEAKEAIWELKASDPYFPMQNPADPPAYFASQQGKNVIVVQLEAFQNFPVRFHLMGQEVTPVLNQLADEGFYFPNVYQQIGQGNTSDAEFISNTSIYPTAKNAMSTAYGDRDIPSLPKLLRERNYETSTFHVNDVKFWDRDKLYGALGFDRYYDNPFFENDHFNEFGTSDELLFRQGVQVLAERQESNGKPFYAQFVTVSGHHPFKIPEEKQFLELPESMKGTQLGDYLQAVRYADYAVGILIEELKANLLWEDTVLVIYGDHFGLQPQDNDPEELEKALGMKYHPRLTRYNIPLIIRVPGQSEGKTFTHVGGQMDIMPTLANLLGIDLRKENFVYFGKDLLNTTHNIIGIRYYMPTGTFINNDILFVPGDSFADGTAVSLKTFEPVGNHNDYRKDYEYIMNLMSFSDEYVKLLPKREEAGGVDN